MRNLKGIFCLSKRKRKEEEIFKNFFKKIFKKIVKEANVCLYYRLFKAFIYKDCELKI
jgi:hypothetical protein